MFSRGCSTFDVTVSSLIVKYYSITEITIVENMGQKRWE